jgi:hypothetical protein
MSVNVRQYPSMSVNVHNVRYLTDIDGRGPPQYARVCQNPVEVYQSARCLQSPPEST